MLNEIDTLNCMTVADFEGMTVGVRHVLANMVQRYFADLSGWDTEVEQGSEYGGLFPITVILTPLFTRDYQVMINCPGIEGDGDNWSIVKSYEDGRFSDMLHSDAQFNPTVMRGHVLNCAGYMSPQLVLDVIPDVLEALDKNPRNASLVADLERRFQCVTAQKNTEYLQTYHVSEITFDSVNALLEEGVWMPKVESSAGRSMIIDLSLVREFVAEFDFQVLASLLVSDTGLKEGHLQSLDYLYLVDC